MAEEKQTNKYLFIIFFTVFLNLLGITIVIPVLAPLFLEKPQEIISGMGLTFAQITILLGFIKGAYPVMQFFGSPVLGSLSDRIGRKKVLIYALAGSLAGYIIFALGIIYRNIPLLFAGRIIDGLTGGNIAVIYSSIADISTDESKARNFGLVGAAFGIGFIIGPAIGGYTSNPAIVSWFNFATPFWLASILILINIILVYLWFPETLTEKKEGKIKPFESIRNIIRVFKFPDYKYIFTVFFLVVLGFTFFTQFFDVYLIKQFDYNRSDIGKLFAYVGIWIAISQGLLTRLSSRYLSSNKILRFSIIGTSVSLLALIFPEKEIYLFFILPFISLFQGQNPPNLLTIISNKTSKKEQGEILGINQSLQSLGLAIPPIIAGFIISMHITFPILTAAICMAAAWIIFMIRKL